jgi:hypothetical protein
MAKRGTRPLPPVKQAQAEYIELYDKVEAGTPWRRQYIEDTRAATRAMLDAHYKKLGIAPLPPLAQQPKRPKR